MPIRREKPLSVIIDELRQFPPESTIEPVDGGAICIHLPNGRIAEVITFTYEDDTL